MRRQVLLAVLLTWLLISLIPQLGLMALLGRAKGKGKG